MPVEVMLSDLIRLELVDPLDSGKQAAKKLSKEKIIRSYRANTGLFMFEQQRDGGCVFLDKNCRCEVYEKRPDVCRGFPVKVGPRIGFCPYKRKL